jgi:pilus assembly protein Flp/PilA
MVVAAWNFGRERNAMKKYPLLLLRLKKDKSAVTALEYGLVAALIAVAIISALSLLGGNLNSTFNNIATTIA